MLFFIFRGEIRTTTAPNTGRYSYLKAPSLEKIVRPVLRELVGHLPLHLQWRNENDQCSEHWSPIFLFACSRQESTNSPTNTGRYSCLIATSLVRKDRLVFRALVGYLPFRLQWTNMNDQCYERVSLLLPLRTITREKKVIPVLQALVGYIPLQLQ
jgi:hypothetical protein